LSGVAKGDLVHRRGAGGNHDAVQPVFLDGLPDERLAGIGAHVLVFGGQDNARIPAQYLGHPLYVYGAGNVESTVADEHADRGHL